MLSLLFPHSSRSTILFLLRPKDPTFIVVIVSIVFALYYKNNYTGILKLFALGRRDTN